MSTAPAGMPSLADRGNASREKLRAVYLVTLVVFMGIASVIAFTGVGAAANVSSYNVANQSAGPDVDISSIDVKSTSSNQFVFTRIVDTTVNSRWTDRDFSGAGATTDSKLWLNLTVSNFNPDVLMGTANVETWDYSVDSNGDATVNISLQPASTERNFSAYQNGLAGPRPPGTSISWTDSYEGSQISSGATVELGMINISSGLGADLDGARLNSDAQVYTFPSFDQSTGNLTIDIASPHCKASAQNAPVATCDASEHNTGGFYNAVVPESFVNSRWGSDVSASDLAGSYSSSSAGATSVDWNISELDDGSIFINATGISYSQGNIQIGESPSADTSSSGSNSVPTTSATTQQVDGGTAVLIDRVTLRDPTVTVPISGATAGGFSVAEASATFDMGTNIDNRMHVTASDSLPAGLAAPPETGDVLGYVTVDVEGNLHDRTTDGSFTLDFAGSEVDPETITAMRYNGTAWSAVPTRALNESVVEVSSPDGFSTFAISTASSQTATPTATATPTETATETATPTETPAPTTTDERTVGVETATPPSTTAPTPGASGPGFGVLLVLTALLLVSAILRRRP